MIWITSSIEYQNDLERLLKSRSDAENSMIVMEECSELAKATSKMYRVMCRVAKEKSGKFLDRKEDLREEMADVMICISMLQHMYKISDVDLEAKIRGKMYRNMQRLKGEDDNE